MSNEGERLSTLEANQKNMSEQITDLKETVVGGFTDLKNDLKENYVSKDSFLPVKAIAYGLVATISLAILSAIIANTIQK